jgi:hypothetical protein
MRSAANDARVFVTWAGQAGDLPESIAYNASDEDIRRRITEAVQNGGIPGIQADKAACFHDFIVDRFEANRARPFRLIQLRPRTPFR